MILRFGHKRNVETFKSLRELSQQAEVESNISLRRMSGDHEDEYNVFGREPQGLKLVQVRRGCR